MKYEHKNINFMQHDFSKFDFRKNNIKYELVLSDIAPNSTGHKSTDHLKISSIIYDLISILDTIAKKDSNLVFKIWKGIEEKNIMYLSTNTNICEKIRKKRKIIKTRYKKLEKYSNIIKKNLKIYLKLLKIRDFASRKKVHKKYYINTETFLGDRINKIEDLFFYKIKASNKLYFGFDIREIYKLISMKKK